MAKDPITVALTGMLPLVMIAGALLAAPAAALLLWLYRRAVLRGMSESRGGAAVSVAAKRRAERLSSCRLQRTQLRRLRFAALGVRLSSTSPRAQPSQ